MCLIISQPKGASIPAEFVTNGIERNPDGWGVMSSHKGRIHYAKGTNADDFPGALADLPGKEKHIHFRYATHGVKDATNCHPFPILDSKYCVMHNGIIDTPIRDKSKSDTWHFCEDVLAPMLARKPGDFGKPAFESAVSTLVGAGNKLVILRRDGATVTVNKKQGVIKSGLWLSNAYSVEPVLPLWKESWGKGKSGSYSRFDELDVEIPDDLLRLEEYSREEIADMCAVDPDGMAELIERFLDQWNSWDADGEASAMDCR